MVLVAKNIYKMMHRDKNIKNMTWVLLSQTYTKYS